MADAERKPPKTRAVFLYKKQLLVARFSDVPGTVLRTTARDDAENAKASTWCSGQCLSTEWEDDILKGVADCENFDEFLRRMKYFKYRVETDEPRIKTRRFMRL